VSEQGIVALASVMQPCSIFALFLLYVCFNFALFLLYFCSILLCCCSGFCHATLLLCFLEDAYRGESLYKFQTTCYTIVVLRHADVTAAPVCLLQSA